MKNLIFKTGRVYTGILKMNRFFTVAESRLLAIIPIFNARLIIIARQTLVEHSRFETNWMDSSASFSFCRFFLVEL